MSGEKRRGRPHKDNPNPYGPKGLKCNQLFDIVFFDEKALYFSLHTLSESSQDKVRGIIKNHAKDFFGDKLVSSIRIQDVSGFRRYLVEKGLSVKSQLDVYSYVKAAFSLAPDIDPEHVTRNAFASKSITPIKKEAAHLTRTPTFTLEEVKLLFSKPWQNPLVQALALTILYTGARVNELVALRYEDFSISKEKELGVEITIEKNFSPGYGMKSTKTEAGFRKVVLPLYVWDFIYPTLNWAPGMLVFSYDGKTLINYFYRSRWFYRELERCEIPRKREGEKEERTLYSLRPFYKSYTSEKLSRELSNFVMGHKDQSMGSHYWHYERSLHAPLLIEAMDGLLDLNFSIFGT